MRREYNPSDSGLRGNQSPDRFGAREMQGVGHPKFEIWVAEDGRPEMIPYADPQGQFFDGESLQEIYKRNG